MIKVTFIDGSSKRYPVGCKQLLCGSWDGVDYRWAFEPIAKIINVDVKSMKEWRVT
jgi:hypothetical protein